MVRPEVTGRAPSEKLAFGIQEFCNLHGISRAHFYNLRNLGLGPREMDVHGRRTISTEAAADWRREREAAANGLSDRLKRSEPREKRTRSVPGQPAPLAGAHRAQARPRAS